MRWLHPCLRFRIVAWTLVLALCPLVTRASECEDWAARAGSAAGLPDGLLPAIARVESGGGGGRESGAWPWTLNEGGKSSYFDTKAEALTYLRAALDKGVTNIDVGCLQLNHRWHGAAFGTLEDMIDPEMNAKYAARFMVELHKRLGSWEDATRAYHSTNPARGNAYLDRVAAAQGTIGDPMMVADMEQPEAMMVVGLLQTTGRALFSMGGASLVSLADGEEQDTPESRSDVYASAALIASAGAIRFDAQVIKMRSRETIAPMPDRQWQQVQAFREDFALQP